MNWSTPSPVFTMPPLEPTTPCRLKSESSAASSCPLKLVALMSSVRWVVPKSTLPTMVEVEAGLAVVETILPSRMSSAPGRLATTWLAVLPPPSSRKMRPASVLEPKRLSVELPLIVTMFEAAIWPAMFCMVTVAPLMISPWVGSRAPGITMPPVVALRFTVPPLTTVPPVWLLVPLPRVMVPPVAESTS